MNIGGKEEGEKYSFLCFFRTKRSGGGGGIRKRAYQLTAAQKKRRRPDGLYDSKGAGKRKGKKGGYILSWRCGGSIKKGKRKSSWIFCATIPDIQKGGGVSGAAEKKKKGGRCPCTRQGKRGKKRGARVHASTKGRKGDSQRAQAILVKRPQAAGRKGGGRLSLGC